MTTDDLRTRARGAAWDTYPKPWDGRVADRREAFIAGALWHAAQQPSREQLHTEFLYRMRTVAAHYRVAGKRGEQVEAGWIEAEADKAVLALLNGDKS